MTADRFEGSDLECVEGRAGWLFMTSFEGVDVRALYCDPTAVPPEVYDTWVRILRQRREHFADTGTAYLTMIVPDNLLVVPHLLPDDIRPVTPSPAERLLSLVDADTADQIAYVRSAMIEGDAEAACRSTDSHWTDWGAYLGYRATMETLSRQLPAVEVLPPDRLVRRTRTAFGSLGAAVEPERSETYEVIEITEDKVRLADSISTHTREMFSVYEQDRPDLPTAVVFRDSAMTAAAKFFSQSFRRVVYTTSANVVQYDLLDLERPDVVIHELGERRLNRAPVEPSLLDFRRTFGELLLPTRSARDNQRRARSLLASGKAQEALRVHDEVLAEGPPLARSMSFRSEVYAALEDPEAAREALVHASVLDPTDAQPHFLLGLAMRAAGSPEAALVSLERAVAAEPRHVGFWTTAIGHALALDHLDRAVELCVEAGKHFPHDAGVHRTRAVALLRVQRFDEAADAARRALEIDPHDDQARRLQVNLLTHLKRWEELEPSLDALHERYPDEPGLAPRLVAVRVHLGLWSDAEPLLAQLAKHEEPGVVQIRGMWARCLVGLERWDEAEDVLRRLVAESPEHAPLLQTLRARRAGASEGPG